MLSLPDRMIGRCTRRGVGRASAKQRSFGISFGRGTINRGGDQMDIGDGHPRLRQEAPSPGGDLSGLWQTTAARWSPKPFG